MKYLYLHSLNNNVCFSWILISGFVYSWAQLSLGRAAESVLWLSRSREKLRGGAGGAAHLSSFLSSQTCGLFRLRHDRLFYLIPNILLEALVPWLWPVDVIIFEHNGLWKAKNKKTIRNTCNRKKFFRLTGSEIIYYLLEDLKKANLTSYQAAWFNRWQLRWKIHSKFFKSDHRITYTWTGSFSGSDIT